MKREMLDKMPFMCEEGVYVLKHDVVNRKSDRRYKGHFECAETWKAGTLIQVKLNLDEEFHLPILRCLWSPYPTKLRGDLVCGVENKGQWEPLLNALDNPPENIRTLLASLEAEGIGFIEPMELLAFLLFIRQVTYGELMAFARNMAAMEEDQFNNWRKTQGLE
jgi:hypothetical protein